jgi:hypothetical protein
MMGELVVIETGEIVEGSAWASREEWVAEGRRLVEVTKRSMFDLGDWYAFGQERSYGQGAALAAEVGVELQTLKNAASVCQSIESSRRRDDLPFSHHQEVAHLEPAKQDELLARAADEGWSQKALRSAIKGADPTTDQWYTPRWLFQQMGVTFDIDVAAPTNPDHRTVPARRYYTEHDDGLTQPWTGLVWCNPPYSHPEPWASKMIDHNNGVLLTHMPNNAHWMTYIQWAATSVRAIQSMHFERPDGSEQRPGYSLLLAAFGTAAHTAISQVEGERVGPLWVSA